MAESRLETFSLIGGPLHSIGRRLHLVRGESNSFPLGIAIGGFLWVVLAGLALVEGLGSRIVSLGALDAHVRLLVAIPLFFACEAWIAPRFGAFVRQIVNAKVVPVAEWPALESEIGRIARWTNAWPVEALLLAASILGSILAPNDYLFGTAARAQSEIVGWWYWGVCIVAYRFLLLRWLARWVLWCHVLWRISRLDLRLIPTHPDGVAGLGELEIVHLHFIPFVLALSAVQSAVLAQGIAHGSIGVAAIYPSLAVLLLIDAIVFVGPLFIFSAKLWRCRVQGLRDYATFASRYVTSFDEKWVHGRSVEPLLGTSDLQSLADLSNSVNVVRNMRIVPVSVRLLIHLGIAAAVPMLPLLLLKYPVDALVQRLFTNLIGF